VSYRLTDRYRLTFDAFNLTDANVSDIDYYYTSRLPGEPREGVTDVHTHPVEPRSFRVNLSASF
jgi:outer membrane receptor protein involved in Fe transport